MDLIRWEPFKELSSLRRQMDRLMDAFYEKESFENLRFLPDLDVSETEDEIVVKADLPGIDEKDLRVTYSGNQLHIKGERKAEKEEKGKNFHTVERSSGNFERMIALPVEVEAEKVKAKYKKGVLEIHLPKKAESKAKAIPITTTSES